MREMREVYVTKGGVYNDITFNKLSNDVVKVTTNMFLAAKEWISEFRVWKPIWRRIHKFQLFVFFSKRIIIHTSSYLLQLWAALSIIVSSKIILRCLCLSMDHLYFICGHVFQKRILAFFSENVSIRYGSNFDIIVNLIITIVDSFYDNNICNVVGVFYH